MANVKKAKVNKSGRNADKQGRFVRLDHGLLHSAAYRGLNPAARTLLVEIVSMFKGDNNGALWLSVRDAAHRIGVADTKTASRAFHDLESAGFIDMTKDAFFSVKAAEASRARCWRLTWEFDHANKKSASNRWKDWVPVHRTVGATRSERGLRVIKAYKKAIQENKIPVVDSSTIPPKSEQSDMVTVEDSSTANPRFTANQPFMIVGDSSTHIATAIGIEPDAVRMGWWRHSEMGVALSRLLCCAVISQSNFNELRAAA